MKILDLAIEDIIPHSRKMIFLDKLEQISDTSLLASINIDKDSYFLQGQAVPAWVGIEYMAQAVAAYAGIQDKIKGNIVKVGLLLGTRAYQSKVPSFPLGSKLFISVKTLYYEDVGLGSFECAIYPDDKDVSDKENALVIANLNVFQPNNMGDFLSGEK